MYQIFDIALDSDIALLELPEIETCKTIIKVRKGIDKNKVLSPSHWFCHWETVNGDIFASCAKGKNGYILRFPKIASFIITYEFDHILYFSEPDTPIETIRHLLLDHIIPKILGQQGRLVLHASAIVLPNGKAIAFLGNSGWGKSTIASSFHESGSQLITDDCLLIDQTKDRITGIPNYYGLRLFHDSADAIFSADKDFSRMAHYSKKKRLIMHKQEIEQNISKITIDAFFILNNPDKLSSTSLIEINPVRGILEFMGLVERMFVLDITDKKNNIKQFQIMSNIIKSEIQVFEMHYPRKHSILRELQAFIKNLDILQ